MNEFFENSRIVRDVREHCPSGLNIVLEFVKFAIVIKLIGSFTNSIAAYVVDNHLEPLETLGGTWLLGIGLMSVVAVCYAALWERMRPRHVGVSFRPVLHVLRDLLVGYLLGFVCMGGSFALAHLFGAFDTQSNLQTVWMWKIGWYVLVYLFQACGEEVMYRGAFMLSAARKNPAWLALLVSSVWFSWHHSPNLGYGPVAFVNLALLAIVCGITVFATGRIWMATTIHAAWNFFQGKVFGVAVSGNLPSPKATLLVSVAKGDGLFSGGDMGLEGSLAATIVLTVVLVLMCAFILRRQRTQRAQHTEVASSPAAAPVITPATAPDEPRATRRIPEV